MAQNKPRNNTKPLTWNSNFQYNDLRLQLIQLLNNKLTIFKNYIIF